MLFALEAVGWLVWCKCAARGSHLQARSRRGAVSRAAPLGCCRLQVFRTEHWARRLGPKRTLPLTAAMLTVTAMCSLGATVLAHPAAALDIAQHPWEVPQLLEGCEGALPWQAALWTGLVTTDVCLLFEVGAGAGAGCSFLRRRGGGGWVGW